MKDSIKANLIVFFLIALVSFAMSSAFASLTVHEEHDSYKLIPIKNDSFEPHYIDEVPTYIPEPVNDTNVTYNNTTNNNNNISEYSESSTGSYSESSSQVETYVERGYNG